jgi:hypothetical protein
MSDAEETGATAKAEIDRLATGAKAYLAQLAAVDCKPRTVQMRIDGVMYTSSKLPASIGLELWPRLTALCGSALVRAVATSDMSGFDARVIVAVADRAMRDGLVTTCTDLLKRVQCEKTPSQPDGGHVIDDFDEHFAGEYGHLLKVCAFALAHNLRGPTFGAR